MLRITPTEKAAAGVHLVLEGRLVGPWVAELETAVRDAALEAGRVHLSLSGVQFVDTEGLMLLQQLADQGVVLQELSPFVQALLNSSG